MHAPLSASTAPCTECVLQVDMLFCELDADASGDIDTAELKVALRQLQEKAARAAEIESAVLAHAEAYRARAALAASKPLDTVCIKSCSVDT